MRHHSLVLLGAFLYLSSNTNAWSLTTAQQNFVDDVNVGNFAVFQSQLGPKATGEVLSFTQHGTLESSPLFLTLLVKGLVIGATGISGGVAGDALGGDKWGNRGAAIGTTAAATCATLFNLLPASLIHDAVFISAMQANNTDIFPQALAFDLSHVTETVQLIGVPGNQSISFLDRNAVPAILVDQHGVPVSSGLETNAFVLSDTGNGVTKYLLGALVSNDPNATGRPVTATDTLRLELGPNLGVPVGTRVDYTGTLVLASGNAQSVCIACQVPEASTLLLLATGFICLIAYRSIRKFAHRASFPGTAISGNKYSS